MDNSTEINLNAYFDQRKAEDEQEDEREEQERQEKIAQALREELGDDAYPLDLNEDDTFDERDGTTNAAVAVMAAIGGDDMYDTPEGRTRGLPANFVTSTPYADAQRQGIHLEEEQDDANLDGLRDDENKYLHAGENERLKVLYDARGHELDRLKEQVRSLQEEASQDTRRLQHERALLLQNQKKLEIEIEGLRQTLDATSQENSAVRQELEEARALGKRQDAERDELLARSEDSDHMVQQLQQQLVELQKRDTLARARERNDEIVSSLKESHEREMSLCRAETERLTKRNRQLEKKIDEYQNRETDHDLAMSDKNQQIEILNQRLSDNQRRLTQALSDKSSQQAEGAHLARSGPSSLEELCQLRTALSEATHAREEQERRIKDLLDEIHEHRSLSIKAEQEVSQLRRRLESMEDEKRKLESKAEEVPRLQQLNVDLTAALASSRRGHEQTEKELDHLRREKQQQQQDVSDFGSRDDVRLLREQLNVKSDELEGLQEKMRHLIQEWEKQALTLRENHSAADRQELDQMTAKYRTLKKKVKARDVRMHQHYRGELNTLRESFHKIFKQYKERMELAYETREKGIESELLALKRQFDEALKQVGATDPYADDDISEATTSVPLPPVMSAVSQNRPPLSSSNPHARSKYSATRRIGGSSDEENAKPTMSEQAARLLAEATRDAASMLKRPPMPETTSMTRRF